jgi:hypothetical protein
MLNLAINSNGGGKKNINQLKAAVASVTETATMTAMTKTMKTKATALLTAARCWQWQRAAIEHKLLLL